MTPADSKNWIIELLNYITKEPIIALIAFLIILIILWLLFKDILSMDDYSWEMMTSVVVVIGFLLLFIMVDKGVIKIDIIGWIKTGIKSLAASL